MAVCISEPVGEYFVTDFAVALSLGKQKNLQTRGSGRKKKVEYRKSKLKFKSHFFRARVGRAKQCGIPVGLGNCVGCKFLSEACFLA